MITRRDFLKIAAFSSLLGLGGALTINAFEKESGQKVLKDIKALKGKRWAMAIDTRKFKTQEDFEKVIRACHKAIMFLKLLTLFMK